MCLFAPSVRRVLAHATSKVTVCQTAKAEVGPERFAVYLSRQLPRARTNWNMAETSRFFCDGRAAPVENETDSETEQVASQAQGRVQAV
jgi:hypothetical protein